ncbi:MAG TPA: Uma2 family endonuclease [Acidobacteriaceae bacterium]|nr:Uma2 family endonuclease [Acidobacteriaceae bacterium]
MNLALNQIELPIRLRTDIPMSDDEFMRFCAANEPVRCERDANGEIIVVSPPGTDGGGLELDVAAELRNWSRQDGRGRAFGPSSGVKLPDGSVRAADAAWISWPRWNALSPSEQEGYAPICPEFVIEVRSKSDRLAPLQQKMDQWIANGAQLAWLIDPIERAITIYRPDDSPEYLTNPTSVQGTGPIQGFELVLSRIWG